MRATAPSARTNARRVCVPPPAPQRRRPGNGSRTCAHARAVPPTPAPRAAPAAGRTKTVARRSSPQPPSKFLEPVATGREHYMVDGQSPQLSGYARTALVLDPRVTFAHAPPRGVDLDELAALGIHQRKIADVRQTRLARVAHLDRHNRVTRGKCTEWADPVFLSAKIRDHYDKSGRRRHASKFHKRVSKPARV